MFVKQVYIPLLFFSGVDYIDAPTPYMMGLHSDVDTSNLAMDGVSLILSRTFSLQNLCYLIFGLTTFPFLGCSGGSWI